MTDIPLKATNESEAKKEMVALSMENPGMYFIAVAVFGLFASKSKRLHVFAPSDCVFDWYVHAGKVTKFTKSQKIADQNNTPQLS